MSKMDSVNRIDSVEIFIVKIPLVEPFETSLAIETHKEALLLKINSEGFYGWGECVTSPDPFFSDETNQTALYILRDYLIPMILKLKDFAIEQVLGMFQRIRGHNMAKATVENALLDLIAKKNSIPLFRLLGGEEKKIMSGISIGLQENPQDLLKSVDLALQKKYHRIKIPTILVI